MLRGGRGHGGSIWGLMGPAATEQQLYGNRPSCQIMSMMQIQHPPLAIGMCGHTLSSADNTCMTDADTVFQQVCSQGGDVYSPCTLIACTQVMHSAKKRAHIASWPSNPHTEQSTTSCCAHHTSRACAGHETLICTGMLHTHCSACGCSGV